jgi:hypothetical protein
MTPSRMSQLLTEALQDVRWAEEQLEAAEAAVLARNGTQLLPEIGQPKLWWFPPVKAVKQVKPANHSNVTFPVPRLPPLPPRLPPWAPASLFTHWPGARAQVAPPLPHFSLPFTPHFSPHFKPPHLTNLTTRDHHRLHRIVRRREPASARRLLQLHAVAEPQQLAGVPDIAVTYADFKALAWSRASTNHTGAPGAPCADALALAVTSTAVLTCLLTLLVVWLLARRLRLHDPPPAKLRVELPAAAVSLAPASDKV